MSRSFRILQLNSARKYVGEAAHTLHLTEALRERGHAVWLGLRKGHETLEHAAARGLEPAAFNMSHRWWPPQDLPDLRQIARLVREHRIELIHAHRGKDHWQAVLASRLFKLGTPVIRTRHVVMPLSSNPANRWLARRTAAMVVVSNAIERNVAETHMYASRLHRIPGGIDVRRFAPASVDQKSAARARLEIPPHVPVAVCVARFAPIKAHPVLLAAWKGVVAEFANARLILVGGGGRMEENQNLAQSLGIAHSVRFMGKRDDVAAILSAADVGVLSSIGSEGFSRAVLEYMAAGLPVVATRVGAVPDLIEDGVHGALAAPGDEKDLCRALRSVLSASAAQLQIWGRAASEKARSDYNYQRWTEAHEQLYADVLSSRALIK